jgi:DNA-binding IclR family transcriptional regulator
MIGSEAVVLPTMPSNGKRSAVHKVADVLRAVVSHRAHSLTAISAATGLPLSTAHRIVTELVESDLLLRTGQGHYQLHESMALPQVGTIHGSSATFPLRNAIAVLDDLAGVTCRTARLGWRQDHHVRLVERIPHRRDLHPHERRDGRPLHASALGRILLAFDTQSVVDSALALPHGTETTNTVADIDGFSQQLDRVRRTLVAYANCAVDQHTSMIAVPVFGGGQIPVMALEIQTVDHTDSQRLEHAVKIAARALRRVLLTAPGRL